MNRFAVFHELELAKRQIGRRVFPLVSLRERRCQARMIERRCSRVLFGIDQNKFRATRRGLTIPEAARLLNPMGIHVRLIKDMPQGSREKLLCRLTILGRPLCSEMGRTKKRQERARKNPGAECKNRSPLLQKGWFSGRLFRLVRTTEAPFSTGEL